MQIQLARLNKEGETMKKDNTASLPFILVSDKVIAERLKQNGFVCVNETETMSTFINNGKLIFDDGLDRQKVSFTNLLCI